MVFLFLLFFPYIFFPKVEHRDEDAERKSLKEKDHKFTPKASIASKFDVDHGRYVRYPFVFFIPAGVTKRRNGMERSGINRNVP